MKLPISSMFASLGLTLVATVAFAQVGGWSGASAPTGGPPPGPICPGFSALSTTTTAAPGVTNGSVGTTRGGEIYTISVSGPGTGTFRIVGDPAGTVTFAGPGNVPATLSYTATGAPPPGAVGVGYYFDAGAGTVTITASCNITPIPVNNPLGLAMLGLLLAVAGVFGVTAMRRRAQQRAG